MAAGSKGKTPVFLNPLQMLEEMIDMSHAVLKTEQKFNLLMTSPGLFR